MGRLITGIFLLFIAVSCVAQTNTRIQLYQLQQGTQGQQIGINSSSDQYYYSLSVAATGDTIIVWNPLTLKMEYRLKSSLLSGIPSGSGTANQWAYWSDTNTLTTSSQLTRDANRVSLGTLLNLKSYAAVGIPGAFGAGDLLYNSSLNAYGGHNGTRTGYFPYSTFGTGTSGSVIYLDANGQIAQNNSAFYWNNANTRLIIGSGIKASTGYLHLRAPNGYVGNLLTMDNNNGSLTFSVNGDGATMATAGTGLWVSGIGVNINSGTRLNFKGGSTAQFQSSNNRPLAFFAEINTSATRIAKIVWGESIIAGGGSQPYAYTPFTISLPAYDVSATTASSSLINGTLIKQTITASDNNIPLQAVYINPTFVQNGFTGVISRGIRYQAINPSATHYAITTNGGLVGFGTETPTEALHVVGNTRITGAIYDSNNDPGTSGQILSSTVTGTDWITLSVYSGWTLAGDGVGTPQSIGSGQTANFLGGYGINTIASATRNLTIELDTTQAVTPTALATAIAGISSYSGFTPAADTGAGSNVTSGGNLTHTGGYGINTSVSGTTVTTEADTLEIATKSYVDSEIAGFITVDSVFYITSLSDTTSLTSAQMGNHIVVSDECNSIYIKAEDSWILVEKAEAYPISGAFVSTLDSIGTTSKTNTFKFTSFINYDTIYTTGFGGTTLSITDTTVVVGSSYYQSTSGQIILTNKCGAIEIYCVTISFTFSGIVTSVERCGGGIWYVSEKGDNATGERGNPHKPLLTISAALDSSVLNRDIIYVFPGTYSTADTIRAGQTIVAETGSNITLNAGAGKIDSKGNLTVVYTPESTVDVLDINANYINITAKPNAGGTLNLRAKEVNFGTSTNTSTAIKTINIIAEKVTQTTEIGNYGTTLSNFNYNVTCNNYSTFGFTFGNGSSGIVMDSNKIVINTNNLSINSKLFFFDVRGSSSFANNSIVINANYVYTSRQMADFMRVYSTNGNTSKIALNIKEYHYIGGGSSLMQKSSGHWGVQFTPEFTLSGHYISDKTPIFLQNTGTTGTGFTFENALLEVKQAGVSIISIPTLNASPTIRFINSALKNDGSTAKINITTETTNAVGDYTDLNNNAKVFLRALSLASTGITQEGYINQTSTSSPLTLSVGDNLINQGSTQATFTFNLPGSPVDGQRCRLVFVNQVTACTVAGGTILGASVTTALAGDVFEYKYFTNASTWIKVK